MPDWSYPTFFRPLLFRLAPTTARDLALRAMGTLARLPLGSRVIDFMGHMNPDRRLQRRRLGILFPGAVGLGVGIDADAQAAPAFERFGFGFLELGPITSEAFRASGPVLRRVDREEIELPDPPDNPGSAALANRLGRDGPRRIPLVVRLAPRPWASAAEAVEECRATAGRLAPLVDAFSLSIRPHALDAPAPPSHLRELLRSVRDAAPGLPILLCLPGDLSAETAIAWADVVRDEGLGGLIVDGGLRSDGIRRMGPASREPARLLVRRLRNHWSDATLIASGGVHEPIDALRLLQAGADLVQIDSGLVYGGPGLPKRINEAVLFLDHGTDVPNAGSDAERPPKMTWFWAMLMGLGMLFGSLMALVIAATRVVLPYDEWFVGMTRSELAGINPHLLGFMTHDRVTLAGVMCTLGVLYCGLSVFGIRRGQHWAMVTVLASATVGFGSFFLFLGFGYLDPMHAFVTGVLFQFLVLALHSNLAVAEVPDRPSLFNDRAWRMSLWGQLLLIVQATLFLMAGVVIAVVGITEVFVPEDLHFMQTTAESLRVASPRLVPLVAHDRATLGGMLVCSGLGFLLSALWGYRRGARWLWWTIALASFPGFAATIAVHMVVGYHDLKHLAPVFLGAGLFAVSLALSYPFLAARDPRTDDAWSRLRASRG
ncbi:MAG: hypothetical protein JWN86_3426 [Planctomycetota bacterium]|nr:hypothetical protein [Planctomycetota bacterium]